MGECAHNFLGEAVCEHCGLYESTFAADEIQRLRAALVAVRDIVERSESARDMHDDILAVLDDLPRGSPT